MTSLNEQPFGSYYRKLAIQPVVFSYKNNLGYCEASAIKYLCRWRDKNGIEDLHKAIHFIELLIELEENEQSRRQVEAPSKT